MGGNLILQMIEEKFDFEIAEELLTEVNHALKDRYMTSQLQ